MPYAGVEAGGTKVVCAVGNGPDTILADTTIPTTTPSQTLGRVVDWLTGQRSDHDIAAVGVACFGPLDLRPGSASYGHITSTPKEGWSDTDVVGRLAGALDLPVGLDTDVNGAAVAEQRWGAAAGDDPVVYITVGTGIGGGAVVGGRPLHGLVHPEMGHLPVRRHPDDDHEGSCRFHGDCLEGLAAGPAIAARFGRSGEELGADAARAVPLLAWYLAQLAAAATYLLSPERIVMGGGVLQLPGLLTAVRSATRRQLAGALRATRLEADLDTYVVAPRFGQRAGVIGALALAADAGASAVEPHDGGARPGST